jgi:hypothetical protein
MNFVVTTEHCKIYITADVIVGITVALFPALLNRTAYRNAFSIQYKTDIRYQIGG